MRYYQLQTKTVSINDKSTLAELAPYLNYCWIEAGKVLEERCLEHQGIRLPAKYATALLRTAVTVLDDEHYTNESEFSKWYIRKTLFGFKNEEDIQEVLRSAFGYLDKKIEKHCEWHRSRHENNDNAIEDNHSWEFWMMASLINYLDGDLRFDDMEELPPEIRSIIKKALEIIKRETVVDDCVKSNIQLAETMLEDYPEIIIHKIDFSGNRQD